MTIYGTADLPEKTKYILNYLHVAAVKAPVYFESIDEFTIWGELPRKDSIEELLERVNEKISTLDWIVGQIGNKLEEMLQIE